MAGDNAIVVGMVAAGLPEAQRARMITIGIAAATLLRIAFAAVTVQLLQIIGLVLVGGLLLLWVCWRLWRELEELRKHGRPAQDEAQELMTPRPAKSMKQAIVQIVVADVSMSLDNVLAVAGIARDNIWLLVTGLVLSVAFMGFAAAFIARLLQRHHWIAYVGLVVIFYVAVSMIVEGSQEISLAMVFL